MTPTHHRARSAVSERSESRLAKSTKTTDKRHYTTVFELVTQDKKKLLISSVNNANSPKGYTFVHIKSTPGLVQHCLEKCRNQELEVYSVFEDDKRRNEVSEQTRRVGYHIPTPVVAKACQFLEYWHDPKLPGIFKRARVEIPLAGEIAKRLEAHRYKEDHEQIALAIRELFPNIPEDSIQPIIDHAFQSGTKRVGTAKDLSLADRVGLAVGAHIRHVHTDYDKLLNVFDWEQCRRAVATEVTKKLKQWRGELADNNRANETEDIFREYIIIDDEDESDDERDSDEDRHALENQIQMIERRDIVPMETRDNLFPATSRYGQTASSSSQVASNAYTSTRPLRGGYSGELDGNIARPISFQLSKRRLPSQASRLLSAVGDERHDTILVEDDEGLHYVAYSDNRVPLLDRNYQSRIYGTEAPRLLSQAVPVYRSRNVMNERLPSSLQSSQYRPAHRPSKIHDESSYLVGDLDNAGRKQAALVDSRPALAERKSEDVPLPSVEQPTADERAHAATKPVSSRGSENEVPASILTQRNRRPHEIQPTYLMRPTDLHHVQPALESKRKSWPGPDSQMKNDSSLTLKRQRLGVVAESGGRPDLGNGLPATKRETIQHIRSPRRIVSNVVDLTASPPSAGLTQYRDGEVLFRSPRRYSPTGKQLARQGTAINFLPPPNPITYDSGQTVAYDSISHESQMNKRAAPDPQLQNDRTSFADNYPEPSERYSRR